MTRTSIIAGPAHVTYNGATFWSKDNIQVQVITDTYMIGSDAHGDVDERKSDQTVQISFTPWGEWEALAVLWPYGATALGSSLMTASDIPLVIWSAAGVKHTFTAAALTQMPDLTLGAVVESPIGQVQFTAIKKNDTAATDAAAFDTITSSAFPGYSTFSKAGFISGALTTAWGSTSPWDAIQTKDGVRIRFPMQFERRQIDSEGTVDLILQSVGCEATMIPVGVTEAQAVALMKIQNTGALLRGASLTGNANDLVISRTGQVVTIHNAAPKTLGMNWTRAANTLRIGEVAFSAIRSQTTGENTTLFTLATS